MDIATAMLAPPIQMKGAIDAAERKLICEVTRNVQGKRRRDGGSVQADDAGPKSGECGGGRRAVGDEIERCSHPPTQSNVFVQFSAKDCF